MPTSKSASRTSGSSSGCRKGGTLLLLTLLALTLAAQLLTATNYPMFRDEFYYLDCAAHADYGYVDQPPLSIWILKVWTLLCGDGLLAVRLLPALAGAAIVALVWKITKELGGGVFACALAALAVLVSPQQRAIAGFYSMNVFDVLIWAAAVLLLIRLVKEDNPRLWIPFGAVVGLGLLNKISLLYFGAGLVVALAATPQRRQFARRELWLGGGLALLLFLPYVIWQFTHDFATLEFVHNATANKNAAFLPHQFLLELGLENNPLTMLMWLGGLGALLIWRRWQPLRLLGWLAAAVLIILMTQKGKPYYAAALMPLLFAAGAVWLENVLAMSSWKWLRMTYLILLIAGGAMLLPMGLRILPPPQLISYMHALGISQAPSEKGHADALWPQHFSDSYGWAELVTEIGNACETLSAEERPHAVVFARNYGEAGAINYYGRAKALPHAYSGQNSCWFWGPPPVDAQTVFILVLKRGDNPNQAFESVTITGAPDNGWAMPYERDNLVWVCRGLKRPMQEVWAGEKDFD